MAGDDEILIRAGEPGDAEAMARLFHDTVHRVNAADYSARQLRAWAPRVPDAAAWRERQRGLHVRVAVIGGKLVGFAELAPNGHVDCFYVHAEHQGCGVGHRLVEALVASARQLGLRRLWVDASVTAAPFFAAEGFVNLGAKRARLRGVRFRQFAMERSL